MKSELKKDVLFTFLDQVLDYRGKTPKKLNGEWQENGYRAISANNVKTDGLKKTESIRCVNDEIYKKWMKLEIQRGDILLTSEAPAGEVMIWNSDEKIVLSQRLFGLRVNDRIYNKYLKYYLQSKLGQKEIMKNTSGSTVFGISAKMFHLINVYYPNKKTQHFIGDFLSDLDAKIEVNNKINKELESMAKTLYDYWFVQFDFPNKEGKPYKTSGGKMVLNEELKREIPEGWEVKKLKEIAKTGSGGTPLKSKIEYYENGTIPWVNSGEVNASFIIRAKKYISELGLNNSSAKLFSKGTILMAMYGATAGQVSLIDFEACTNQAICGINPIDQKYTSYIKFSLEDLYQYLINLSTGSARDNLSQDKIKELNMIVPNEKLLVEFDKIASSNLNQILLNLKQNQELTKLRDWLLPMLMNGQVTVGQAQEELAKVAEDVVGYKRG